MHNIAEVSNMDEGLAKSNPLASGTLAMAICHLDACSLLSSFAIYQREFEALLQIPWSRSGIPQGDSRTNCECQLAADMVLCGRPLGLRVVRQLRRRRLSGGSGRRRDRDAGRAAGCAADEPLLRDPAAARLRRLPALRGAHGAGQGDTYSCLCLFVPGAPSSRGSRMYRLQLCCSRHPSIALALAFE